MQIVNPHPCILCGACCASFRVAFYWREAEKGSAHEVPVELTEDLDFHTRCMKNTAKKHNPKCVALKGRIGELAYCTIYENRPSPCRVFKASYEDGLQNKKCDQAREQHGLKALTKDDWKKLRESDLEL